MDTYPGVTHCRYGFKDDKTTKIERCTRFQDLVLLCGDGFANKRIFTNQRQTGPGLVLLFGFGQRFRMREATRNRAVQKTIGTAKS